MSAPAADRAIRAGSPPLLLADHMLIRLGRWLRAAGYDCAMPADGASDRRVLEQAVAEGRLLLTRDRRLTELRGAGGRVIWLAANSVPACAREVTQRLGIDWLRDPFSRCLLCNRPLIAADPAVWWRGRPGEAAEVAPLMRCAACDKLYWQGGHARRMRAKLEGWARGEFGDREDPSGAK